MESEQSKKEVNFIQLDYLSMEEIKCAYAFKVFAWLIRHKNSITKLCYPSESKLVTETGLSLNTIKRAIKYLVNINKLKVIKTSGKNNHYEPLVNKKPKSNPGLIETSMSNYTSNPGLLGPSNPGLIETTPRPIRATNNIKKQDKEKTTTTKAPPKSAPHALLELSKSSSSSFFESNKEKEVPVYLLETIGFTIGHVSQIASKGILTIEEITESIKAYANVLNFDSKKTKAIKDPIAYFMGILKNGNTYLLPESTKKLMTKKATSPTKSLTEEERRKYENEAFRRTKAELLGNS